MALSRPSCPGNEDGRFWLEGNTLFYLSNDLAEPRTFVLLVEVWGSPGVPRRSTVVALVVRVTPWTTPVPPSTTTWHTVSRARWLGGGRRSVRPAGPHVSPHPTTSADTAEGAAGHHTDGGGVASTGLVCDCADCIQCPAAGCPGLRGPEPAVQVSPGPMALHSVAQHGTAQHAGLMAAFCSSRSNKAPGKLLLDKRWVLHGRGSRISSEGQPRVLVGWHRFP